MSPPRRDICRGCGVALTLENARPHAVNLDGEPMFVGACRVCESEESKARNRRRKARDAGV